jgi:hypothetical protein
MIVAHELLPRRNQSLGICTNSRRQIWTAICSEFSTTLPGNCLIAGVALMTRPNAKLLAGEHEVAGNLEK